ncbi:DUF3052 domain-containing protein [Brachybacterium muris]|uniref:DUF3052 domain-containing protein n=1 Tax=Brachybacterium muris TaxID=219301 RepID=UPI00195B97FB|nr:DUF3052 domain-containing protein [Brachybacterium muris]MBM7500777.1 hypothetical protein [Brachybacterium muris]MCT1430228.1 DUF3052 domain-containing protein [Brachybacterium muris]MCT1997106.1 DUF3052 domain-containing protein [Brachybacterium muris]MCT2177076.1 DUF3052 domain-containing protein [Brachybacterium muris]MCT2295340.1 DUF3052 domain-containing protein [Brachybacterium muris]
MSPSADPRQQRTPAEVLGFTNGQLVQEIGYDDDVDLELRDTMEDLIGAELEDEDCQDIVDAVVLWWREGDGDLTDALVDSLSTLDAGAPIWLLCPKAGRDGHVRPAEVQEAAETAGLRVMSTVSLAQDWTGTRLASRT